MKSAIIKNLRSHKQAANLMKSVRERVEAVMRNKYESLATHHFSLNSVVNDLLIPKIW